MNTIFSGDSGFFPEYLNTNNDSVLLLEYLSDPKINIKNKLYIMNTIMKTLLLDSNNELFLEQYLAKDNGVPDHYKARCFSTFVSFTNNNGIIKNFLKNPNYDPDKKVKLIETLFKPRQCLKDKSCFEIMPIFDQMLLLENIFLPIAHHPPLLGQYLADNGIGRDEKDQSLNKLFDSNIITKYLNLDGTQRYELIKIFLNHKMG